MTALETDKARTKTKDILAQCLENPTKLSLVEHSILQAIMKIGAPQKFKDTPPSEYLVKGLISTEITDRAKKIAIKKTLTLLDSINIEQLILFNKGEINNE